MKIFSFHYCRWYKLSSSPTFYARLFRTKVLSKAFMYLHFRFKLILVKEFLHKWAYKNVGEIDQGCRCHVSQRHCVITWKARDIWIKKPFEKKDNNVLKIISKVREFFLSHRHNLKLKQKNVLKVFLKKIEYNSLYKFVLLSHCSFNPDSSLSWTLLWLATSCSHLSSTATVWYPKKGNCIQVCQGSLPS